jgi:trans-2,3-dihydro-3-hydroxyanthranilate isomerase
MKRTYAYRVVDVFTDHPFEGNALAVFVDAAGLDDTTMQKIARELNLSETTFVFASSRPDCAADVRIFTPMKEMIFAGHPTIGTSYVLLDERPALKNAEGFSLEEKVGPVAIRVEARGAEDQPLIWLRTPAIEYGKTYDASRCARALGLHRADLLDVEPQLLSAGNPTIYVAVKDKAVVDRAWLDMQGMRAIKDSDSEPVCVFVFTPTAEGAYSRMFAPEYGVVEDPATGSSTGPLASFMMRHGLMPEKAGTRRISEQGTKMGRRSVLHILINGEGGCEGIDVGGYVTPVATGTLTI